MTCIAALVDNKGIGWMGGDRAVGLGDSTYIVNTPKIVRAGAALIGTYGAHLIGNWLTENRRPSLSFGTHPYNWLRNELVPWLYKSATRTGQWVPRGGILDPCMDGQLLVVAAGEIYRVSQDLAVVHYAAKYHVLGPDEAMGVLWMTDPKRSTLDVDHPKEIKPQFRILKALQCAETYDAYVSRPFDIFNTAGGYWQAHPINP